MWNELAEFESAECERELFEFEAEKLALAAALVKELSADGRLVSGTMLANIVSQLSALPALEILPGREPVSAAGTKDSRRPDDGRGPSVMFRWLMRRRGGMSATAPDVSTISGRARSRDWRFWSSRERSQGS